jgi:hypothetical protein
MNQSKRKGEMPMEQEKKPYFEPKLTVHGDIEVITLKGGSVNPTDIPKGLPHNAFPLS